VYGGSIREANFENWILYIFLLFDIVEYYWIIFQGVRGAYSESAAQKAYPNCEAVPCEQFDTAFEVNILLPLADFFLHRQSIIPLDC
jgi:hypothetical protein